MRNENFENAVERILQKDKRYPRDAYTLLPIVLDFTERRVREQLRQGEREDHEDPAHVTGAQLAEGYRDYMLEEFGPFAYGISQDLKIETTLDIGHLVYNLIAVGCFGKTEEDRLEDFDNVFDLKVALCEGYEVKHPDFLAEHQDDDTRLA